MIIKNNKFIFDSGNKIQDIYNKQRFTKNTAYGVVQKYTQAHYDWLLQLY